jgi:hyperosmotically inducible periplasmic protein
MRRQSRGQGAAAALLFGLAVTALGGFTACDRTSGADADNTARNARDSSGKTVTPTDQSENEGDRAITQRVRKAVVDNDALSTNAHNVKIVTANGVVTLRGPVATAQEKNTVVAAAQMTPGVKRVDDQLEVKAAD